MRTIKKAQGGVTATPKKTWQQMSAGEKGAKKKELIEKGGIALFNKYKDSISNEAMNRREADINKAASSRGMTRAEYESWYKKQSKKPDQPSCDTADPNFKSTKCGTSKAASKESKKEWGKKKNGGSVKAKDGKWMQKAAASIKRRGTEGKCTPITKPGCTGKAKALAKTFKKIAAKRKGK